MDDPKDDLEPGAKRLAEQIFAGYKMRGEDVPPSIGLNIALHSVAVSLKRIADAYGAADMPLPEYRDFAAGFAGALGKRCEADLTENEASNLSVAWANAPIP